MHADKTTTNMNQKTLQKEATISKCSSWHDQIRAWLKNSQLDLELAGSDYYLKFKLQSHPKYSTINVMLKNLNTYMCNIQTSVRLD